MMGNDGDKTCVSIPDDDSCSNSEKDEDEDTTVAEYSDNYGSQSIDLPAVDASNLVTTVVKMKNSSNVEIKPVTEVTIHQYFQNSNQPGSGDRVPTISQYCTQSRKAEPDKESEPRVALDTSKKKFYHAITSHLSWKLGIILTVTVAVIVIVTAVCLTVIKKGETAYTLQNMYTPENPITPRDNLGNGTHIFTRQWWGGRLIRNGYQNRTLVHPIKLVIIGHTASQQCMTFDSCASSLQSIQSAHVANYDYVDIGYNFLVGGDGNIYEALGWDIRNYLRNNSIQIQFLGNYVYDSVLDEQQIGVQALLEYGVKSGKLDKDYLLVAHSQVSPTLSPGKFLLDVIKLWPHYYSDILTESSVI